MTATAQRVGTLRYLAADWRNSLFGPDHPGATDTWIHTLRTTPDQDTPAAIALTNVPYREIRDPHLGVLHVGPQEPARIHDQLAGGAR